MRRGTFSFQYFIFGLGVIAIFAGFFFIVLNSAYSEYYSERVEQADCDGAVLISSSEVCNDICLNHTQSGWNIKSETLCKNVSKPFEVNSWSFEPVCVCEESVFSSSIKRYIW